MFKFFSLNKTISKNLCKKSFVSKLALLGEVLLIASGCAADDTAQTNAWNKKQVNKGSQTSSANQKEHKKAEGVNYNSDFDIYFGDLEEGIISFEDAMAAAQVEAPDTSDLRF